MRATISTIALFAALSLCACTKPIPPERAAYVGDWHSPTMVLLITSTGSVSYWRHENGMNTSVDAPLEKFEGNDFIVGVGPISTRFIVSVMPHQDGADWKMTVDGVELVRTQATNVSNEA